MTKGDAKDAACRAANVGRTQSAAAVAAHAFLRGSDVSVMNAVDRVVRREHIIETIGVATCRAWVGVT